MKVLAISNEYDLKSSLEMMKIGDENLPNPFRVSEKIGSTLFIDIKNVLSFNDAMNSYFWGTDYLQIIDEIEKNKDGIDEVIFTISSPGGDVAGLNETAEYIKNLGISTVAYIEDCCASAAYYLAAACDQIISNPSARIGSIGTIIALMKPNEDVDVFVSNRATCKTYQGTDEQKAYYQDQVNKYGEEFTSFVANNRKITNQDEAFSGKMFLSSDALELGLIDSLLSWTDFKVMKKSLNNQKM